MIEFIGVMVLIVAALDLFDDDFDIKKTITKIVGGILIVIISIVMKSYGVGF